MTSIYTHLETRRVDFYKDGTWNPSGFVQKATISDTTTAYRLKNKQKNLFEPITKNKIIVRKAKHYDDTNYLLQKSYYSFMHNFPSFAEQV
ncbi:MAG: hypothetical protein ACERKZ_19530 [Lachnotalea sp.]